MAKRRVVVTGLGMVSPMGLTVPQSWGAILKGESGVKSIDFFDTTNFPVKISASVRNFDASGCLDNKEIKKLSLFVQFTMVAAHEAIQDAGLSPHSLDPSRIGVAIGSGIGGLSAIEAGYRCLTEGGPRKISPFFIPSAIVNMAAGYVSIKHGFKGPNISIVTACTSGTHNIGHAARMISYGDADVMLAGGAEMATTALGINGFAAARALSTRNDAPEKASRPWDRDRDGFVLGDGAGVLVLEEYEQAKKRNATIYAEVVGFGMSADAFHMTMPGDDGAVNSMKNALKDAGMQVEEVDYINAHGTSTHVGDKAEVNAIKLAFGDHAYRLCVSSTKSMTGHLLGAAGAVEAIFSVLAIRDQVAPPTINLDHPDEGCDLDFVPHVAQQRKIDIVLSNSFGFGGTNGSLLFKKI